MSYAESKIMKTGKTIFTVTHLSNLLGVDKTTVRRYIQDGKLKGNKFLRVYLIKRSDILNFLELYNYYS